MTFWEFVTSLQWTYYVAVAAVLVPWYLVLVARALQARIDIRSEFFTAAFLIVAAEILFGVGIGITALIAPDVGLEWVLPVHTFIVFPLAFIVLGVAAASSERTGFRVWAGTAFAVHLLYVLGMLGWFASTGELRFAHPEAFFLVATVPIFVWMWRRSVALLTGVRKGAALVFRLLLIALVAVGLSEPQVVKTQDEMAVIFLVDRSASMPGLLPHWYAEYITDKMSLDGGGFRPEKVSYAIVAFAGDPAVVQVLTKEKIARMHEPDDLARDVTDIAAGVRQALAMFPENAHKRIVILSDGNANRGDILGDLRLAQHYGVTIDVVPIDTARPRDVRIERLDVPGELRLGQRFEPKLVIFSTHACTVKLSVLVNGIPETMPPDVGNHVRQLELERDALNDPVTGVADPEARNQRIEEIDAELLSIRLQYPPPTVELKPGRNYPVLPGRRYNEPGFYEFTVEIDADSADDLVPQNNRGSAFTVIRGRNRMLYVHGDSLKSNEDFLAELRAVFASGNDPSAVTIDVRNAINMPQSVAEWRIYDCVVLSNVPAAAWKEQQQRALVEAINVYGVGLVMLGGDNSYGAGGYQDQPLVEALPVKMEIEQQEFIPAGALLIVLHTCEIPDWNRWTKQMCHAALDALSERDEFGIVMFDFGGGYRSYIPLQQISDSANRLRLKQMIDAAQPGDMPSFAPAFAQAYKELALSTASTRHCIVISDGDPTQPSLSVIASHFKNSGITTSGIVVTPHSPSDKRNMMDIARAGGDPATWQDRYYDVTGTSLNTLPQIFTKEAVRVRTSLVQNGTFNVLPQGQPEFSEGIARYPHVFGFVGVTPKPRTQTPLRVQLASDPASQPHPLMTYWQHGLGRVVCFMSDVKNPGWLASQGGQPGWWGWGQFRQFWGNVVTWTARKSRADEEIATMRATLVDGRGHIVVDAVNAKGEPIILNDLTATVIDPAIKRLSVPLEMVEPGRYEGWFDAPRQGSYQIYTAYTQGDEPFVLTGGVSVPYSREYRDTSTNTALLASIASRTGGKMVKATIVPAGEARLTDNVPDSNTPLLLDSHGDFLVNPETDEFLINPATGGRVIYDPFAQDLPIARSFSPIWQPFVIAALFVLLLDVFFRKVFVSWTQVTDTLAPVMSRIPIARRIFDVPEEVPVAEMQRLRAIKAQIAGKHDSHRQARVRDVEKALAELQHDGALPVPSRVKVEDEKAERVARAADVRTGKAAPAEDAGFLKSLKQKAKDAAKRPADSGGPSSAAAPPPKPPTPSAGKPPASSGGGLFDRLKDAKRGAVDDDKRKDK